MSGYLFQWDMAEGKAKRRLAISVLDIISGSQVLDPFEAAVHYVVLSAIWRMETTDGTAGIGAIGEKTTLDGGY